MAKKIETTINCINIAPISNLRKTIHSNSLKFGIFANNGSGKTFISRLFRITENKSLNDYTDNIISFDKSDASFLFRVKSHTDGTVENLNIQLKRGHTPTITGNKYIYHTFNQDYIDYNIRADNYDKDGNIDGTIIMGADNIDITKHKKELEIIKESGVKLKDEIKDDINTFLDSNINAISNIRRLKEYKKLNIDELINTVEKGTILPVTKGYESLIEDYKKLENIPDNLEDIKKSNKLNIDENTLNGIKTILKKPFSLSELNEIFKNKIKRKQSFIEEGIRIYDENADKRCPFCEQTLQDSAIEVINAYNNYLQDEESKTIKSLNTYIKNLEQYKSTILYIEAFYNKQLNIFNEYKAKYFSRYNEKNINEINVKDINDSIDKVIHVLEIKIENIRIPITDKDSLIDSIILSQDIINRFISLNNETITHFNNVKYNTSEESRIIRNQICSASFSYLMDVNIIKLKKILDLRTEYHNLNLIISQKSKKQKISRKEKVASMIKVILNCFFYEKYSFDENTFRLTFNNRPLKEQQARSVLSEGEKSIVAFAYYMGDIYLKISEKKDFEKLFLIIDDPISSMDFTHVYTLCGILRDIDKIITELDRVRLLIFTHNNEFMRILSSNNIVDTKLILNNDKINDYNTSATVPYIHHLIDIYNIAHNGADIKHTTANSIRHIIETLTKFKHFDTSKANISQYLENNIRKSVDNGIYTLINDLSHGAWRNDQAPISNIQFENICKAIIEHIKKDFQGQFEYCKKSC